MRHSASKLLIILLLFTVLTIPASTALSEPEPEYPPTPEIEYLFGGLDFPTIPGFEGGIPGIPGGGPQGFMQLIMEAMSGFSGILDGYCHQLVGEFDVVTGLVGELEGVFDDLVGQVTGVYDDYTQVAFDYWDKVAEKVSLESLTSALPDIIDLNQIALINGIAPSLQNLAGTYTGGVLAQFTEGPKNMLGSVKGVNNLLGDRVSDGISQLDILSPLFDIGNPDYLLQGLPPLPELIPHAQYGLESYAGVLTGEIENITNLKILNNNFYNVELSNLNSLLNGPTPGPFLAQADNLINSCGSSVQTLQGQAASTLQTINSLQGSLDTAVEAQNLSELSPLQDELKAAKIQYSDQQNKIKHYENCVDQVVNWRDIVNSEGGNAAGQDYFSGALGDFLTESNQLLSSSQGVIEDLRSDVLGRITDITSIPSETIMPYLNGMHQTIDQYVTNPLAGINQGINGAISDLNGLGNSLADAVGEIEVVQSLTSFVDQVDSNILQIQDQIGDLQDEITNLIPEIGDLGQLLSGAEQLLMDSFSELLDIGDLYNEALDDLAGLTGELGAPLCGEITGGIIEGTFGEFTGFPAFDFDIAGSILEAFEGLDLPFGGFGGGGFPDFPFFLDGSSGDEVPYKTPKLANRKPKLYRNVEGCYRPKAKRLKRFFTQRRGLSLSKATRRIKRHRRLFRQCRTYQRGLVLEHIANLNPAELFDNYFEQRTGVPVVTRIVTLRAQLEDALD